MCETQASASSTPRSSFHVRCTEGMDIFSRGVWISSRSGPKDTQSSPGSLPENRPHSNPAWMASIFGAWPYCYVNTRTIVSRSAESRLYSHAG